MAGVDYMPTFTLALLARGHLSPNFELEPSI